MTRTARRSDNLRIGLDIDGPMYDFPGAVARYLQVRTGRSAVELGPVVHFDFFEKDWGLSREEFLDLRAAGIEAGVIFGTGEPVPGARDALANFRAAGHSLHVVTARWATSRVRELTKRWLAENGLVYDTLTFSNDKTTVRTDVFIDDSPEHVDALRAVGTEAFLFDCQRVDQVGHPWLVRGWGEFQERVNEIALRRAA